MTVPVPQNYQPFRSLSVCSNTLVNVRVPMAVDGTPLFLIGRGFGAPLVWISARASPDQVGIWGYVIHESQTENGALSVRVDLLKRSVLVTTRPPSKAPRQEVVLLSVTAQNEDSAVIDQLDLRPFGVNVVGDSNGLSLGGNMFSRNMIEGPEVAWMLGGALPPSPRTSPKGSAG